ncbi:MAG TPA: AtpZ/AtpI family protein, partial [Nodosilinea sp.]|nr:AtpZ/AtpI family protein [Nodosilinea sp.]
MKPTLSPVEPRPLSARAKNSRFSSFMGRVGVAMVVAPAGGYLLGRFVDHRWPGSLPWAYVLLLLGLTIGCINLWAWLKTASPPS